MQTTCSGDKKSVLLRKINLESRSTLEYRFSGTSRQRTWSTFNYMGFYTKNKTKANKKKQSAAHAQGVLTISCYLKAVSHVVLQRRRMREVDAFIVSSCDQCDEFNSRFRHTIQSQTTYVLRTRYYTPEHV